MPTNNYQNSAADYALRGLTGTDLLAFRSIAGRLQNYDPSGKNVLDIGCGSGRSTRFLKDLGFKVTGVDISESMIAEARKRDSSGAYKACNPRDPLPFDDQSFDLFLASWVVLEQDSRELLKRFMREACRILRTGGTGFIVANTPEFYRHRWVSCEVDFPENKGGLQTGQKVIARLMPEGVIVTDVFWNDQDYREAILQAGLSVKFVHHPKAPPTEPGWADETRVAPWVIYEVDKVE